MTQVTEFAETEATGILDWVIFLMENIKLLVFGPSIFALVGLGIAFVLPQSYTSSAIISMPNLLTAAQMSQQVATIIGSPVVLDPVIDILGLSPGLSRDVARARLASQLKSSVGKDNLLRLEVTAKSPVDAQKIATTVISVWLKSTKPSDQERADLEKRLEYTKTSLATVDKVFLEMLAGDPKERLGMSRKDAGISLVAIAELRDRYLEQILVLPRALEGVSPDVVKQLPTLPTMAAKPKKLMVVIAFTAVGVVLSLLLILIHSWLDKANASPVITEKIAHLRSRVSSLWRKP